MPYYQKLDSFKRCDHLAFKDFHQPSGQVSVGGIYRCDCGFEVAIQASVAIPGLLPETQRCLDHSADWRGNAGRPVWILVAAAIHQTVS